jgi:A/G-specific adenine glycosylase
MTPVAKARFQRVVPKLLRWYAKHGRDFIWRRTGRAPYTVLVTEFMLQQTTAQLAERKLPQFLKLFPTAKRLATASTSEVLRAWQGLGYNRRALNLHRAAKELSIRKTFPDSIEELMALPGVGRYTAAAVLAFAFNRDVPVVDVNIERVLSRLYKRMPDTNATLAIPRCFAIDEVIMPKGKSSLWHEALMDFGATICTRRNPKCESCFLLHDCPSGKTFLTQNIATPAKRAKETTFFGHPRRIWRGRVLTAISKQDGIAKTSLVKQLRETWLVDSPEFVTFLEDILSSLCAEGFCEMRGRSYFLKKR